MMYSEFDVSFFGTSGPQLSQSHKNSNIQIEFISRRPILEIPDELENTNQQAVAMEQKKQEDVATPTPSSWSSSSSENIQTNKEEEKEAENQTNKEEEEKEGEVVVAAKDDDDGYQTPTSPRYRIPPAINCPPAPKKPTMAKRWHCIRIKGGRGRVRRRIEIESDTDDPGRRNKKMKKASP